MIAGISTACFYPMYTEEALFQLARQGVAAAEVFLNSQSELEPAYLKELRRVADAAGVRLLSVHPFTSGMEPMLFFSGYQRRFADGRELYRSYYRAANILGAGMVVFHGNIAQFRMEREDYFQRFGILMADAAREGVELCHENVSRCTGRSPDFFLDMARYLPESRYVFDVKQAVRAGEDVFEFAEAMGKRVAHVHISDHNVDHDCMVLGQGVFHTREFLSYLRSQGFDGGVIVELYRENFGDVVELYESYQHLCREISTVAQS